MLCETKRKHKATSKDRKHNKLQISQLKRYQTKKNDISTIRNITLKPKGFNDIEQGYFNPVLYQKAILLQHFALLMCYNDVSLLDYNDINNVMINSDELNELFIEYATQKIKSEIELDIAFEDNSISIKEIKYYSEWEELHPELYWLEDLYKTNKDVYLAITSTISSLYHRCCFPCLTSFVNMEDYRGGEYDIEDNEIYYQDAIKSSELIDKEIEKSNFIKVLKNEYGFTNTQKFINKSIDKENCTFIKELKELYLFFIHSGHSLNDYICSYGGGEVSIDSFYYPIWKHCDAEYFMTQQTYAYIEDVAVNSFQNWYTFDLETKEIDDCFYDSYVSKYFKFLKLLIKLKKKYGTKL